VLNLEFIPETKRMQAVPEVPGAGQTEQWTFSDFYPSVKGRGSSIASRARCMAALLSKAILQPLEKGGG
jgi:hypothetical protein